METRSGKKPLFGLDKSIPNPFLDFDVCPDYMNISHSYVEYDRVTRPPTTVMYGKKLMRVPVMVSSITPKPTRLHFPALDCLYAFNSSEIGFTSWIPLLALDDLDADRILQITGSGRPPSSRAEPSSFSLDVDFPDLQSYIDKLPPQIETPFQPLPPREPPYSAPKLPKLEMIERSEVKGKIWELELLIAPIMAAFANLPIESVLISAKVEVINVLNSFLHFCGPHTYKDRNEEQMFGPQDYDKEKDSIALLPNMHKAMPTRIDNRPEYKFRKYESEKGFFGHWKTAKEYFEFKLSVWEKLDPYIREALIAIRGLKIKPKTKNQWGWTGYGDESKLVQYEDPAKLIPVFFTVRTGIEKREEKNFAKALRFYVETSTGKFVNMRPRFKKKLIWHFHKDMPLDTFLRI